MGALPSNISGRLCFMLACHGLTLLPDEGDGIKRFENRLCPALGKIVFIGEKGAVRVGDSLSTSLPSPVLKHRLLSEFSHHVKKLNKGGTTTK